MQNPKRGAYPSHDEFLAAILGKPESVVSSAEFLDAVLGKRAPVVSAAEFLAVILGEQNFNPDEPRDERGRWTTGGSGDSSEFEVCFGRGTPVAMADGGWKPIEEVQAGELVLSVSQHDPEDKVEAKPVIRTYHNKPQPLVDLHLGDEVIRATPNHPFYVRGKGWTPVAELETRHQFRSYNGDWVELSGTVATETVEPVFNIEVADHHTYFVGTSTGSTSVLVHNDSTTGDGGKEIDAKDSTEAAKKLNGLIKASPKLRKDLKRVAKNTKTVERGGVILKAVDPTTVPQGKFVEETSKDNTETTCKFSTGVKGYLPQVPPNGTLDLDAAAGKKLDPQYKVVGTWHTHPPFPAGDAQPSAQDVQTSNNDVPGVGIQLLPGNPDAATPTPDRYDVWMTDEKKGYFHVGEWDDN